MDALGARTDVDVWYNITNRVGFSVKIQLT